MLQMLSGSWSMEVEYQGPNEGRGSVVWASWKQRESELVVDYDPALSNFDNYVKVAKAVAADAWTGNLSISWIGAPSSRGMFFVGVPVTPDESLSVESFRTLGKMERKEEEVV